MGQQLLHLYRDSFNTQYRQTASTVYRTFCRFRRDCIPAIPSRAPGGTARRSPQGRPGAEGPGRILIGAAAPANSRRSA